MAIVIFYTNGDSFPFIVSKTVPRCASRDPPDLFIYVGVTFHNEIKPLQQYFASKLGSWLFPSNLVLFRFFSSLAPPGPTISLVGHLFVLFQPEQQQRPSLRDCFRHSNNIMLLPSHSFSFGNLLNAGFAVELRQLMVHPPPPYTVFLYPTVDRSKHPTFENAKCLQILLEHRPCFLPVKNYWSIESFVHGALRTGSEFVRPHGLVQPIVGTTSADNASSNITAVIVACCDQRAKVDKLVDHLELVAVDYNVTTERNSD